MSALVRACLTPWSATAVCPAQSSSTAAPFGTDSRLTAPSRRCLIETAATHGTSCGMTGESMQLRFRYLVEDVDRYGSIRLYVRVPGRPKVRIRAQFGTDEFISAYNAAVSDHVTAPWQPRRVKPGSFGHLCQLYYAGGAFKLLDAATQSWRRRALGTICDEHADKPVSLMLPRHVRQIRDELKST